MAYCALSGILVNFMCQLNWTIGCPDIWPSIILGVSVGVFLGEINIQLVDRVKQIALPHVGGPHPIS